MSRVSVDPVANSPRPGVRLNTGDRPTLPGHPSAKILKQQLKVVDQMLRKQGEALHRKIIEIQMGGETAVLKAQKQAIEKEALRLRQAREYWLKILQKELDRLKAAGAPEEALPKLPGPPDSIFLEAEEIRPEEIGLDRSQMIPLPPPPDPGQEKCGENTNPKLTDDEFLQRRWQRYWEDYHSAQQQNQRTWERWNVRKFLFEMRRLKALRERKLFLEKEPPRPSLEPGPPLPDCPEPAQL